MKYLGGIGILFGALIVLSLAAPVARAAPGGKLYAFGDSLLDLKNVCPLEYSNGYGSCGNGRGLLQALPNYAPYSFSLANDYAAGGAGTGSFNIASVISPNAIGTLAQIDNFMAAGGHIAGNDLVLVSGRNNFYQFGANPNLQGSVLAQQALGNVHDEISGLVNAGAEDLIYFDSRSPSAPFTTQVDIYENAFAAGLPSTLAPFARPGVRLRLLNLTGLSAAVAANPTRYGFTSGVSCANTAGCEASSKAEQDTHFLYDQHPTQTGYTLIAQYIASLDASADGIAAQADVAAAASNDFAATLLNQANIDGLVPAKRGVFVDAGYSEDNRPSEYTASGGAAGYQDGITHVTVGYSAPIANALLLGGAFGYAHSSASLNDNAGSLNGDSYSGGGYLDWRPGQGFLDTALGYTYDNLNADRPGVVQDLTSKPVAWTITLQAHGGWLKNFGAFRLGPIGSFDYSHTQVHGYTEQGDPLLAQIVSSTTENAVIAGAGGRVEMSNTMQTLAGYFELSANHNFQNGNRVLQTANIYAAALPIYTVVKTSPTGQNFGLVNAVFTGALTPRVSLNLRAGTSFSEYVNNYVFQAGIHILF